MKGRVQGGKAGTWIVRRVPADLMRRIRMAAIAQDKTVRQILIELAEVHLQDLERKGILPRGKG